MQTAKNFEIAAAAKYSDGVGVLSVSGVKVFPDGRVTVLGCDKYFLAFSYTIHCIAPSKHPT